MSLNQFIVNVQRSFAAYTKRTLVACTGIGMLLAERHQTTLYRDTKTSHLCLRWMGLSVWIETLACLHAVAVVVATVVDVDAARLSVSSSRHQPFSMCACVLVLVFLEFVKRVRVCAPARRIEWDFDAVLFAVAIANNMYRRWWRKWHEKQRISFVSMHIFS